MELTIKQEQKQQPRQKALLYVLRKKTKWNRWDTISYIDKDGYFRGQSVFYSRSDAEEYMQRYKDKMSKLYLHEGSGRHGNASNRVRGLKIDNQELKIFEEETFPEIHSPYIFKSK